LEIAGLDLAETELVTLSACQTGIGDLKGSEGLYGLHRSFLLAGAKTVLASLWSVPDLETKDLMIEFYRRYLSDEKMSKSETLRQAQLTVIEQLRKKYGAAHPAYWGAFVCIGEP
jgi:CHAT domain-containing protein